MAGCCLAAATVVCIASVVLPGSLQQRGLDVRGRAVPAAGWSALEEEETPEQAWERQMNITAEMFKQWHVVRDVRVLPNPDYMHRDTSLPRALQGTSVDEVADRAAHRAIADIEQQQAEEDEAWAHPDEDLIASIVPEGADDGAGPDSGEEGEEEEEEEEERARAENLKRIRWLQNARRAAGYAAASQTAIDRAQIRDWEEEHPAVFPEHIVFPLAEYPDGRALPAVFEDDDDVDDDDED